MAWVLEGHHVISMVAVLPPRCTPVCFAPGHLPSADLIIGGCKFPKPLIDRLKGLRTRSLGDHLTVFSIRTYIHVPRYSWYICSSGLGEDGDPRRSNPNDYIRRGIRDAFVVGKLPSSL